MTLLPALILGLQASSLTHSYGVVRADLLVKAISDQTGWGLSAGPSLKQDYVYANVKGLTKEQAMAALADMLQAKWKPKNGGQEITSSYAAGSAQQILTAEMVHAFFAKERAGQPEFTGAEAMGILKDWAAASDSPDDPDGRTEAQEHRLPLQRAARASVIALGEGFWTGLRQGTTAVFCERPTAVQRSFTPALAGVVQRLDREFRLYFDAVSQFSRRPKENEWSPFFTPYTDLGRAYGPLEIIAANTNGHPTCEIRIFGTKEDEGYASIAVRLDEGLSSRPNPKDAEILASSGMTALDTPLNLSSSWTEAVEGISSAVRGGEPPARLQEALKSPDGPDLLDLAMREPLDRIADSTGRGLLAVVPDSALYGGRTKGRTKGEALVRLAQNPFGPLLFRTSTAGGNDVLSPQRLELSRAGRYDREALASLGRAMAAGPVSIDLLADFSLAAPTAATVGMAARFLRGQKGEKAGALSPADMSLLRVYGRLAAPLRAQAASQGILLDFGGLPPASQEDAASLIYCHSANLVDSAAPKPKDMPLPQESVLEVGPFANPFSDDGRSFLRPAWALEPSRALGSGIPASSAIALRIESRSLWHGLNTAQPGAAAKPVDLLNLAVSIVMAGQGDTGVWAGAADAFYQGTTQRLSAGFRFPASLLLDKAFLLNTINTDRRFTLDTLPEDARTAVQKAIERVRGMLKNSPAQPGGARPPAF